MHSMKAMAADATAAEAVMAADHRAAAVTAADIPEARVTLEDFAAAGADTTATPEPMPAVSVAAMVEAASPAA